jgi:hypothetical protein
VDNRTFPNNGVPLSLPVPVALFTQAITGHSSCTTAYGIYGSALLVGNIAEELKEVLKA